MIITMVIDQFGDENNGTTISTRRFASALTKRGHEVRIVAASNSNNNDKMVYAVPERKVPVVNYFSKKQGMYFGRPDKKILEKAIKGSDVVHVLMPFKLEKVAMKMAKKEGIPVTGAFHVQPENVTAQLGLVNYEPANKFVYKLFKDNFYKNLTHVHCPSQMIADELAKNGYKAKTHVITNGCDDAFKMMDIEKPDKFKDKFVILSVGRLSPEKRHDILIDAIRQSKYKDKIQVIIAGKGPLANELKHRGKDLPNPPIFDFFPKEELIKIINYSDLYVHPADIEIEAISCVEAFKCGVVPIISNNPKCATKQFALDEMNLFNHGDSKMLAERIDFWIEHPENKAELSKKYIEYGKEFAVDNAIVKIEEMFLKAIEENKKNN